MSHQQQLNKYICKHCGRIIETTNKAGFYCCGTRQTRMWRKCPVCGVEKWMSHSAKQCRQCAIGKFEVMADVPHEILHGKPERIQQLIKYNWWTQNELALTVAKCDTAEQAESLYQDFLRDRAKIEFHSNGFANNFENI